MEMHRLRTRALAAFALEARRDDDFRRVLRILDRLAGISRQTGTDALGLAVIDWYETLRQHLFDGHPPAAARLQPHWLADGRAHGATLVDTRRAPTSQWATRLLKAYLRGDDDGYLASYREAWAAPDGAFVDHVLAALDVCALTIRDQPRGCAVRRDPG